MSLNWFKKTAALAAIACAFGPASLAIAQKDRNTAKPGRTTSLETSKKVKYRDKTSVDFDAADIDGSAKNPFGTMVQSRDQDFNKGFIKLRYHWHDQMVMSLSGLSGN